MLNTPNTSPSAQALGRTLRQIRLNKRWSLREFELASGGQIKDVVLGSYERGSRSISVSKLQVIAATYAVPMSAFFPAEGMDNTKNSQGPTIIDLRKLRLALLNPQSNSVHLLDLYAKSIINLRKDWNGEILSLRKGDLTLLSMMAANESDKLEAFFISIG